jgi:hypothetical protein
LREDHRLRDEVTEKWRRLHNEELYALYSSPYVIRVIKSRRMSCAGHVACIGGRRSAHGVSWGNLNGRSHVEDLGVDGKLILKWFLKN